MNKNGFGILLAFLILISLLLLYFILTNKKVNVEVAKVEETVEVAHHVHDDVIKRLINLEHKVLELEQKIMNHQAPQTTVSQTPRPVVRTTEVLVKRQDKPAARAKADNLTHVKNVNGEIIFCVMANDHGGMHFPQYALERGVKFTAVESNTTSDGSNWVVTPTKEMEGDYGITFDGTFYVCHSVIQSTMDQELYKLAIKSQYTSWRAIAMKREGDYWIYKTMK